MTLGVTTEITKRSHPPSSLTIADGLNLQVKLRGDWEFGGQAAKFAASGHLRIRIACPAFFSAP
jgi:hypothetical protein